MGAEHSTRRGDSDKRRGMKLLDIPPAQLAKHLTKIERNLFLRIPPSQLLHQSCRSVFFSFCHSNHHHHHRYHTHHSHHHPHSFSRAHQTASINSTVTATSATDAQISELLLFVEWFQQTSYWVATEIVVQPTNKRKAQVIQHWIDIATVCDSIHSNIM
jgi:hypothetical protein